MSHFTAGQGNSERRKENSTCQHYEWGNPQSKQESTRKPGVDICGICVNNKVRDSTKTSSAINASQETGSSQRQGRGRLSPASQISSDNWYSETFRRNTAPSFSRKVKENMKVKCMSHTDRHRDINHLQHHWPKPDSAPPPQENIQARSGRPAIDTSKIPTIPNKKQNNNPLPASSETTIRPPECRKSVEPGVGNAGSWILRMTLIFLLGLLSPV